MHACALGCAAGRAPVLFMLHGMGHARSNLATLRAAAACTRSQSRAPTPTRLRLRLQIRRYVYRDVVKVDDLRRFYDPSGVQTYTVNHAQAVFLTAKDKSLVGPYYRVDSSSACRTCNRGLRDGCLYCSLRCKVCRPTRRRRIPLLLARSLHRCPAASASPAPAPLAVAQSCRGAPVAGIWLVLLDGRRRGPGRAPCCGIRHELGLSIIVARPSPMYFPSAALSPCTVVLRPLCQLPSRLAAKVDVWPGPAAVCVGAERRGGCCSHPCAWLALLPAACLR